MSKKSNLHIGNIGGNLNVKGDIVAGDKITTSHWSSTTNYGFQKEEDKAEFILKINELLSMMQHIMSQINEIQGFDENQKKEIIEEIMDQVKALKTAKTEADTVSVGQEALQEKAEAIKDCLDKSGNLIDKLKKIGDKTVKFGDKVLPLVSKALTILLNMRILFGLA